MAKNIIININPDMCTQRVKEALQKTIEDINIRRSEFITPEHLFASIIKQKEFVDFCDSSFIMWKNLQSEIEEFINKSIDTIPADDNESMPVLSVAFRKLIDNVQKDAQENNDNIISIQGVILMMSEIEGSYAAYLISKYLGEEPDDWYSDLYSAYVDDVSDLINKQEHNAQNKVEDVENLSQEEIYERMMKSAGRLMSALGAIGQAAKGAQPELPRREPWEDWVTCISDTYKYRNPLIGREEEIERTVQILCRKDKNNPLHIGEAGVGKTALIYGLAARIAQGDVPEALQGFRIYSMDMGTIVAGASYNGEMEKRIKDVLEGMIRHGKCILYIDEIHNIMGTGSSGKGSMDVSNILKPYLEDGDIRFIGSTTYQEYNRNMATSHGIARRFQQIDVQEPTVEQTIDIINGLLKHYETHHGVRYDADAVRYAVEKSASLIADRFLPDKAIDIIDEAGAYRQIHPLRNKKGEVMSAGRQKIDCKLVSEILSKVCKINAKALTDNDNSALMNLEENISAEIYGQQNAISQVVRAVKMSKAGLTIGDKPLASLLFVGPTGVGKTEVCKVLAQQLGIELIRFDMSEYTEKHTVAKLIGSPAGYIGYEDGGLLTDAIRKSPNCVLLLDEIEKAHSDIYNILLQVMDYARLTDNKGNKADFRNVILVMTSNAGAQYAGQASIGFSGGQTKGEAMLQSVKKTFKPEFLNRLSGTVVFRDMDRHMASLILEKKLRQLSSLLHKKNVTLSLTDAARSFLLSKGFTPLYGAREMDRVIQSLLIPLLMDDILFGNLRNGGTVTIDCNDETLVML